MRLYRYKDAWPSKQKSLLVSIVLCHTYCWHILAPVALASDEQGTLPQAFVLPKEALQADVDVRCNLKLICRDARLACMHHFAILTNFSDGMRGKMSLQGACYSLFGRWDRRKCVFTTKRALQTSPMQKSTASTLSSGLPMRSLKANRKEHARSKMHLDVAADTTQY